MSTQNYEMHSQRVSIISLDDFLKRGALMLKKEMLQLTVKEEMGYSFEGVRLSEDGHSAGARRLLTTLVGCSAMPGQNVFLLNFF